MITFILILGCVSIVVGALMLILQSAKKFKLSDEQLKQIKAREHEQQLKDKE
ncbi:hypothetical protein tinsulaeT_08360 [Thalassotalea insulae]|uniref:DUF2897 family protein n=1 Tax=Thalassotalea insulae TaxID=2056778 RepID=A0ABQ6GTK9_9GAMM|nr:DUF2897 family protein [Thalassotalea insulae]GLX77496.1 hypothetical protein tinsulaeT_08360 [Thalassotalea insulae]